ncbi:RAB11-binding protein RELCH homolog isoform X3 [Petromyzon marinus]|uniref:RAB11-binding protein RELCH homolog isoform X3 n=1 Tax=Petromyzon marinus TaxID=7757 RepID=UPI003F72CA5B
MATSSSINPFLSDSDDSDNDSDGGGGGGGGAGSRIPRAPASEPAQQSPASRVKRPSSPASPISPQQQQRQQQQHHRSPPPSAFSAASSFSGSCPAAAAAAAPWHCDPGELAGRGGLPPVSLDALAERLLQEQLLLTALELHTEMAESGRELPRLRDFFSNPGNFERPPAGPPATAFARDAGGLLPAAAAAAPGVLNRAGSASTLDSLDFTRYSDDGGRETEERVADSELPAAEPANYSQEAAVQEPIRPLEKRALNFLVNEFLLKNNCKLSSITFSDENDDQDFDDWDDVGLNVSKPADLLSLYRECVARHGSAATADASVGPAEEPGHTDAVGSVALIKELQGRIGTLDRENQSLTAHIRKLERDLEALQSPHEWSPAPSPRGAVGDHSGGEAVDPRDEQPPTERPDTRAKLSGRSEVTGQGSEGATSSQTGAPVAPVAAAASGPEGVGDRGNGGPRADPQVVFDKPDRKLPPAFHQALLSVCRTAPASRLSSEVSQIPGTERGALLMLSRCLPHIVPNVLLAKREELIPLILCTAFLHPDHKERDRLLHILFNLIKRPDEQQRRMILTGCLAFAVHAGPTRVESELLPQCWEQINHKYPERRLLVAEACGALAPYLPRVIRSSLVLSMLQQMLMDDKTDVVREAVIKSLGVLMGYMDDPDKYPQGFELLMMALGDPAERVVSATHQVFLPAFAAWAMELGELEPHLLHTLLSRIETLVREAEYGLDERRLHLYLTALQSLIPPLFAHALVHSPFAETARQGPATSPIEVTRFPRPASLLQDVATLVGSRELLASLLCHYEHQLQQGGTTGWASLLWVVNQLLPRLIAMMGKISVTSAVSVHEFSRFFWRLCRTFGRTFTNTKVKPQFQELLRLSEEHVESFPNMEDPILTKATVPIYATGVLTCYNQEEDRKLLTGFLQDVLTTLSLTSSPLDSLKAAFLELGANPVYHESLLTVLWYGVVHTSAHVRRTSASMFELLVKGVNETLVAQRVVPALITLASDPEISVRIATVPAFGTIMESVTQKELLERVKMQLSSFLEDAQYRDAHALHTEIVHSFGRVGPNAEPKFRDEFVIPHLHKLAAANNHQHNEGKRMGMALQLFEAYSALSCCFISDELMTTHFLPGLRCLRCDLEFLSPEHEVIVATMIREWELKLEAKSSADASGLSFPAALGSAEDAKTKFLSKVGQLTTSSVMLANVFQRKK